MSKSNLQIMDSHAHLTSEEFPMETEGVIARAKEAGIERIINICTNPKELEAGLLLEDRHPELIRNVACTTPHDAEKETKDTFAFFEKHAKAGALIGIGETGFDDFIEPDNQKQQQEVCRSYIDLGVRCNLPVVFHVRGDKAFESLYGAASEFPAFTGIVHCFTGDRKQAEKALELGWYISISGIATFKRSEELRAVIKHIPLSNLLIETDAPWLAPQGYRGKPNEPAYVKIVAQTIADVHDLSLEEVCSKTYSNGCKALNILK